MQRRPGHPEYLHGGGSCQETTHITYLPSICSNFRGCAIDEHSVRGGRAGFYAQWHPEACLCCSDAVSGRLEIPQGLFSGFNHLNTYTVIQIHIYVYTYACQFNPCPSCMSFQAYMLERYPTNHSAARPVVVECVEAGVLPDLFLQGNKYMFPCKKRSGSTHALASKVWVETARA